MSYAHPPIVQSALKNMDETQRLTFEAEFSRRKRSKGLLIVLSIIFPIQLFLLGKVGLGIAFLLTSGGLFVWWIIEIFLTSSRVDTYNGEIATNIVRDIKIME